MHYLFFVLPTPYNALRSILLLKHWDNTSLPCKFNRVTMSRRFGRESVQLWLSVGIPSVFCCNQDPFIQFNIYCMSNIIHPATPPPDDTCNFYLHTACRNSFFTTAICQWRTRCSNYRIMAAQASVNNSLLVRFGIYYYYYIAFTQTIICEVFYIFLFTTNNAFQLENNWIRDTYKTRSGNMNLN